MIYGAISHIAGQLNQYLKQVFELNEDMVVLSNLTEQDGTVSTNAVSRIVASLINIEKDAAPGRLSSTASTTGPFSTLSPPPVHTNLYLLFSCNFKGKNYAEALKLLSSTISFFQRNPLFTHQNSPALDPRINKLCLDIENLNIKDLSSLWTILSGKYLPSVLYKIRMITFDAQDINNRVPKLKEPETHTNPY